MINKNNVKRILGPSEYSWWVFVIQEKYSPNTNGMSDIWVFLWALFLLLNCPLLPTPLPYFLIQQSFRLQCARFQEGEVSREHDWRGHWMCEEGMKGWQCGDANEDKIPRIHPSTQAQFALHFDIIYWELHQAMYKGYKEIQTTVYVERFSGMFKVWLWANWWILHGSSGGSPMTRTNYFLVIYSRFFKYDLKL